MGSFTTRGVFSERDTFPTRRRRIEMISTRPLATFGPILLQPPSTHPFPSWVPQYVSARSRCTVTPDTPDLRRARGRRHSPGSLTMVSPDREHSPLLNTVFGRPLNLSHSGGNAVAGAPHGAIFRHLHFERLKSDLMFQASMSASFVTAGGLDVFTSPGDSIPHAILYLELIPRPGLTVGAIPPICPRARPP